MASEHAGGAAGARAFMVDRLEDLEDGVVAFALLIEDEGAIFHAADGEEADVFTAGEFLRGFFDAVGGGGVVGRGGTDDVVEMVGNERFV